MDTVTESNRSSLLSPASSAVASATAAAVAGHAEQITAKFYSSLFNAHPELLRVFNQGNQATGDQSRALAASVVAYAVSLIDPAAPSFDHVMRRISYKHVSLGIRPEQYTVVAEHLMGAVGEVLGDAVTPEVAAGWSEVYWLFALQLVAEEARLYAAAGVDASQPTRPYRVVRRIEETDDVISLALEPADGGPPPEISPGQRIDLRQPAQRRPAAAAVHRVVHGGRHPAADHRTAGARRRRRSRRPGVQLPP
jgi:nitric oxide dioxygenase